MSTEDVERALTAAGERWRSGQPPPPDVDTARFLRAATGLTGRARAWAPLAAVAGVAAILAVVVLPVALGRGGGDATPAGSDPQAPASQQPPRPAVPVEGIGQLLREADGTTKLCAGVTVLTSLPPAGAGCSAVFVLVTGADDSWFTQEATSGQRWSETVRVEGHHVNQTLTISRIEPFIPDTAPLVEPAVPCPEPAGGWGPDYGMDSGADQPAMLERLATHVRSDPSRFTDVWEGHPDGASAGELAPTRKVYVVGTTGDVDQARAELGALYPGNLCVHKVAYSVADLDRIVERLRSVSATPIEAEALVIENKVRVKVVALDPPTSAILDEIGREALIIDEPLLQWLD
jgi:hypothetical protein